METILFLIIAGILSSIFGKAKGKNNPGTRTKPFPSKGFNEFRTKVEQQMAGIPSNKEQMISSGVSVNQENDTKSLEKKYHELKQYPVIPKLQEKPLQPSKNVKTKVESGDITLEKPDEKTIINGIIWAEILGEPRAKKPYSSRKG
ncbi:hypothetical protein [Neobacillus niacini]|uniref:hypothetical protein n=1 Tax=Neobacillus niacini TaxID=86668 RepID=UPI003982FE3C